MERLQLLGKLLDQFGAGRARFREMTAGADHHGVAVMHLLRDPMPGHVRIIAVQEDHGQRVAVGLDQGDAATHRNRAGRRVEGDVLLLADLTADITEYTGGQRRGQIAVLFLRVEDEVVDDDFRVLRYGQRRLIGE